MIPKLKLLITLLLFLIFLFPTRASAQEVSSLTIEAKAFSLDGINPEIKVWQSDIIIGTASLPAGNDYQIYTINLNTPAKTDLRILLYLSNGLKTETAFRGVYFDRIQINNEWIEAESDRTLYRYQQTIQSYKPLKIDGNRTVFALEQASTFIVDPPNPANPYTNLNLYFGDPHVHTNYSDGRQSQEFALDFAKNTSQLDFVSITDHAHIADPIYGQLTEEEWPILINLNNQYNIPGQFVTLNAFEWDRWCNPDGSSLGHKNIYYQSEGPLIRAQPADTGQTLWSALNGQEAITIPHHVAAVQHKRGDFVPSHCYSTDWSYRQDQLQPLVEIYSEWGSGECEVCLLNRSNLYNPTMEPGGEYFESGKFVQDALSRGFRLGFIAGGDVHTSQPGVQNTPFPWPGYSFPNRGLTGVWSNQLTREAIYQALKQKRVYGTTGNRTKIKFSADGHFMGEEDLTATSPTFSVDVEAYDNQYQPQPAIIDKVEIVKGAFGVSSPFPVAYSHTACHDQTNCNFTWSDTGFTQDAFYYLRVILKKTPWPFIGTYIDNNNQTTTLDLPHLAWSSPIWVTKTALAGDADDDGDADLADLAIWLNNYLKQTSLGQTEADFNQDTKVNALDFGIWLKNYSL